MRDVQIHFHGRHDFAGFVADRRGLHHPVGRGALLADPGLLAVVALPIGERLLHRAVRAFGGAALVGREAEVARLRVEHLGELPVVGDQPVIPVLNRDDAGDHVEEALVLVPLAVQLDLLGADFAAHEVHGGGELAHFIRASDVHPRGIVPAGDRRSPGDQAPDRTVDEAHDEEKDDRGSHEEGGQGQPDDPFFHEADFFFRLGERHHHVERAEDVLVGGVEMARAGRTPRLVVDRADDPQELLPVGGDKGAHALGKPDLDQGRLRVVADVAGLRTDVGDLLDLLGPVGKLDGALFVVDADVLDVVQPRDVGDDLVDVVAGVQHHRVVRAQTDGVAEPLGLRDDLVLEAGFLVGDAEIRPGGNGQQQRGADTQDQLGHHAAADSGDKLAHDAARGGGTKPGRPGDGAGFEQRGSGVPVRRRRVEAPGDTAGVRRAP